MQRGGSASTSRNVTSPLVNASVIDWAKSRSEEAAASPPWRLPTQPVSTWWNAFTSSRLVYSHDKLEYGSFADAAANTDLIVLSGNRGTVSIATALVTHRIGCALSDDSCLRKLDKFVIIVGSTNAGRECKELLGKIFPHVITTLHVPGDHEPLYAIGTNASAVHMGTSGLIVLPETAITLLGCGSNVGSYILDSSLMDSSLSNRNITQSIGRFLTKAATELRTFTKCRAEFVKKDRAMGRLIITSTMEQKWITYWEKEIDRLRAFGLKGAHHISATIVNMRRTGTPVNDRPTPPAQLSPLSPSLHRYGSRGFGHIPPLPFGPTPFGSGVLSGASSPAISGTVNTSADEDERDAKLLRRSARISIRKGGMD